MIFELPDIFFGSHKKRKGITTTAGETVRIYKKGRKSLTTSGFFKKSGDIFFGATSQKISSFLLERRDFSCCITKKWLCKCGLTKSSDIFFIFTRLSVIIKSDKRRRLL